MKGFVSELKACCVRARAWRIFMLSGAASEDHRQVR